jgi:glycosyltransferase involved in cell wall biosynthesis
MIRNNLAIVIPAYKADFFDEALLSIVSQTCKDFTLYIGDDCSPNNLYATVCKYEGLINIVYKKFEKNIGGTDLVAQWDRCLDMVQGEEWIWLFSDDDIMENNCVECFYNELALNTSLDLFHFNVKVIDNSGLILKEPQKFPTRLTVEDFFLKRINYELRSFIVEYIFRKELYLRKGKFQNFDLAWCSDDATWIKFGLEKGIYTIPNGNVLWRFSGSNISSLVTDIDLVYRKITSSIDYIHWAINFFEKRNIALKVSKQKEIKWILGSVSSGRSLSIKERCNLYQFVLKKMNVKITDVKVMGWAILSLLKK